VDVCELFGVFVQEVPLNKAQDGFALFVTLKNAVDVQFEPVKTPDNKMLSGAPEPTTNCS